MGKPCLEMRQIFKTYEGVNIANNGINFSVDEGEIHALVGENGAGKSTLMKILFGIEKKDSGQIILRGNPIEVDCPATAISNGIGMVHQHFMLCPSLTVVENVMLGMMPYKGLFVDMQKAIQITMDIVKKYNMDVVPTAKVYDLPVGVKQKIEIIKALVRGARLLVLDEPTAVLTPQETQELFHRLKLLKDDGYTIIFISHKLSEIFEICDRATVLRGAQTIGTVSIKDVTEAKLAQMIIGYDMPGEIPKSKYEPQQSVLRVENLSFVNKWGKTMISDASFTVRSGQICGIAAIEGNGQRELIDCMTGVSEKSNGKVLLLGEDISQLSMGDIRAKGLTYIPEDRMDQGCALNLSISENIIALQYKERRFRKRLFNNKKAITAYTSQLAKEYRVKATSVAQHINELSGGNMQKVVVAREFSYPSQLLIAEQPTRGIDIGSARFIHEKLIEYRKVGGAVLLISADINEVLALCDILLVMHGGKIVACFDNVSQVNSSLLGEYMLGIKAMSSEEIVRKGAFYDE